MIKPRDPLENIVFIKIPDRLFPVLAGAFPSSRLIPYERTTPTPAPSEVTVEAIIAGMLRILIYQPAHPDADSYKTIVMALRPNIKEEFTRAGRIKAELKDFPVAIEVFQALRSLFPDCPICAFNLAVAYHDAARNCRGDREQQSYYADEAFRAYRSSLSKDNALPDTHLNYGYFLLEQENYAKALAHFEEYLRYETDALKKAPVEKIISDLSIFKRQDGLFQEAFDDISLGKEESGIEKVSHVLEHHPDFWNGWFLLGWGQRRLGRYREAKEAFLKALALAPPKPDLLNELAIVHMELGELEESHQRLVAALKLEPENVKVLSNLGVVSYRLNRRQEAADFFKTVLEYSAGDQLAQSYLELLEKK